jgi:hypothetical protein
MNTHIGLTAACCAALSCLTCPATSASAGISNGGFENNLTHWTSEGNVTIKSAPPYSPTEGTKLVAFNDANTTGTARIYQNLDTTAGQNHTLAFDVGNLGYKNHALRLRVMIGGYVGTQWHTLHLGEVEIPGTTGGRTRWLSQSIHFIPLPGQAVLVEFSDASSHSHSLDLVLDNVTLAQTPAEEVLFENGGFEAGFDHWTTSGNVAIRNAPPYLATEGRNLAAFNTGDSANGGSLSRLIPTIPGQRYLLSFDVGNLSYNKLHQRLTVMGAQFGYKQFQIYDSIDIPGPGRGATAWVAASYLFTAHAATTSIWFGDSSTATFSTDLFLDNVRVTPVPPSGQLINGSFENGFDGWTVNTDLGGVSVEDSPPYQPTDGSKLAAFSSGNSGNFATLSQTVDTIPGRVYDLVLDVGNLSYTPRTQCLRTLIDDGNYRLLNVPVWISSAPVPGGTRWLRDRTYRFTARGTRTTFTFIDASSFTQGIDLVLDHIRLIPR